MAGHHVAHNFQRGVLMVKLWRRVVAWTLALLLSACGGGSVEIYWGPSPSGWVTIDPTQSTVCDSATLSGEAFISPTYWNCCSGTAQQMTAVTVSWRNETTGASGLASQSVQVGSLVPLYDHVWTATVPLALGSNRIAITATDVAGITATARTTVDKTGASYTISGRVATASGDWGIGQVESGASVQAVGPVQASALPSSGASGGQYTLSCLPAGQYQVRPQSAPWAFAFSPSVRVVDVVASNVSGVDFQAPAQRLSGRVSWAANGAPSAGDLLTVSQGGNSLARLSNPQGDFGFVLPDGLYRVTPSDPYCPGCVVYQPAWRDVTLQGADVAGVDFVH